MTRKERPGKERHDLQQEPQVVYSPTPAVFTQNLESVFVLSDTHFFHDNIIVYQNRPQDHHGLMISLWNKTVGWQEPVLHLGDVVHGVSLQQIEAEFPHLSGKIYLVRGNHDRASRAILFKKKGWNIIKAFSIPYKNFEVHFSHVPLPEAFLGDKGINVHGHIHGHEPPTIHHINVSVERQNYMPVKLVPLLDEKVTELEQYLAKKQSKNKHKPAKTVS